MVLHRPYLNHRPAGLTDQSYAPHWGGGGGQILLPCLTSDPLLVEVQENGIRKLSTRSILSVQKFCSSSLSPGQDQVKGNYDLFLVGYGAQLMNSISCTPATVY